MSKKLAQGWKVEKLLDICDLIRGTEPGSGSYTENQADIRFLRISDISKSNDKRIYTNSSKIVQVLEQDLLISLDGTPGIVVDGMCGAISSGIRKIAINDEKELSKAYLKYYLRSESVQRVIKKYSTGATILHASKSLPHIEVKFPQLEEQERIVSILERAESAIQKRKESNMLLDELVKSKFIKMFGHLATNTKGWEEDKIEKSCLYIVDCINRTAPIADCNTEFKMIRTSNIKNGRIDTMNCNYVEEEVYNKWTRRLIPQKGDVLFTREAPTGEVGIVKTDEKIFLGQRIMHYRPDCKKINPYYLLYHLLDKSIEFQINKLATGSTVKHLSVNDCKEFIIKIPPIELQNEFAEFIEQIDKLKLKIENSLKELENNFNSLMQRAFNGEL